MADAIFEDPRLAGVYDPLDPDRRDLDVYLALVDELGAHSVLDIGCGTGTFACALAARGIDVTAVDPAAASLDVAATKAGADAVRWVHGDATALPPLSVDAAFMTGNVAQVFVTHDEWPATLHVSRDALRPGGWVFESMSTLIFRERAELEASLIDARFEVVEVRDAPDRPGCEFVFLARRSERI